MAQNYVEIRVKALDTAKPELDDLKLQLDELGRKLETAKVDVDDEDASVKLLRMNARLADINAKVANPKIKIAGAAKAEADLLALNLELDKLKAKADEQKGGGLLGKLLFGSGGSGSSDKGGLLGSFGSAPSGAGFGELLTNPYGLAAIGAGITALLPELTGLVSGFAAAGAGAGAFALLAAPAIGRVEAAYTALNTAQQAYQAAQAKYNLDPTKTNATALKSAADNLKLAQEAFDKLPSSERKAADGLHGLTSEFAKMSTAFAPEAFKVFAAGLQLLTNLLPVVTPFATTFANVMSGLLRTLDNSLFSQQVETVSRSVHGLVGSITKVGPSPGFLQFLDQFHALEGPALTAIGKGLGQVIIQLGKLLTVMSSKDVVNAINIAFSVLSGTIDGLRHVVEAIMRSWDVTSKTMARDARQVATAFDALRHDIATWADDIVRLFEQLPGKILDALAMLPVMLFRAGVAAIEGLLHGMESAVGGVLSTVAGWGHDIANALGSPFGIHFSEPSEATQMVKAGQNIASGLSAGMLSGRGAVAAAASQLSGAAGIGAGGTAAAAGGGDIVFKLGAGGSGLEAQFWAWLKNGVRAQGGDPAMFTRKVKFL